VGGEEYRLVEEHVLSLSERADFGTMIAISLGILNKGRGACFIRELVLKLELGDKTFNFEGSLLLNEKALTKDRKTATDADKFEGHFHGFWMSAGTTREALMPVFTLVTEKDDVVLARKNIRSGKYKHSIVGRDESGKVIGTSLEREIEITEQLVLNSYNGGDTSFRICD
jgi:hypothetical protein